ncbi:MAG TPA: FAD binding domain-containing protein [Candidatus Scatomorpha gallistercoris]|nr:FAD binding domain-containing protein [Candidatus Scatomorpha gallistercoris]
MALPEFDYVAAKSLEEASQLMVSMGSECVVMSGGTDVILQIPKNVERGMKTVIDLKTIPGLTRLEYVDGEGLYVGANTKLFDIQSSPAVLEKMPAVAQAAHYVGSSQVRRKGTMVGSICNASPTGDCGSILLAMKAQVKIVGPEGERTVGMDDFWTGFKRIAPDKLKGELVTGIFIPELKSGEGSAYFKHSVRKAMDLAIVGVAAWVKLEGKTVADCRIAVAGGDVTIVRAKAAEQMIIGRELTDELVEAVAAQAADEMHPRSSLRASAEYRHDMIRVYTKRAINKAVETMKA